MRRRVTNREAYRQEAGPLRAAREGSDASPSHLHQPAFDDILRTIFATADFADLQAAMLLERLEGMVLLPRTLARLFHSAHEALAPFPAASIERGFVQIIEGCWLDVFWDPRQPWTERRLCISGLVPLIAGYLNRSGLEMISMRLCHNVAHGYHEQEGRPLDADDARVQTELLRVFLDLLRLRVSGACEDAVWEGLNQLEHPETGNALRRLFHSGWEPVVEGDDRFRCLAAEYERLGRPEGQG